MKLIFVFLEFKQRLSHNKIRDYLGNYEEVTKQLLNLYLQHSKNIMEPDFTHEEVRTALHSFASGKSPGIDGYPPDIFNFAGETLVIAITNVMNGIKNT